MNNQLSIKDIRAAIEFNEGNRLYKRDPEFIRVYFTYVGGRYNGQRSGVESLYYLNQLESDLAAGAYQIDDIEVISTGDAWQVYFKVAVQEAV